MSRGYWRTTPPRSSHATKDWPAMEHEKYRDVDGILKNSTFPLRSGEKDEKSTEKPSRKTKPKRSVGSVGGSDPEHHKQPGPLPPRTITITTAAARQRSSPTDLTIQARLCACACVVSRLAPHATLPNCACARARIDTPLYIIKLCAPVATGPGFHIDTKHRRRRTTTTTMTTTTNNNNTTTTTTTTTTLGSLVFTDTYHTPTFGPKVTSFGFFCYIYYSGNLVAVSVLGVERVLCVYSLHRSPRYNKQYDFIHR